MSKVQTKLNFIEKKKTSARLQEQFSKKQKDLNHKSAVINDDELHNCKSPVKVLADKNEVIEKKHSKKRGVLNKCLEKENQATFKNRSLSPDKTGAPDTPSKQEEDRHLLRSSPLKRASTSPDKCKDGGASPPKRGCSQVETPSQLISNLFLESPERQQKSNSRKELFPKGEFDEACKALHSSAPNSLPGREDKLDIIKDYLTEHSTEQTSGTLYISGPPGTGKTASVNLAVADPQIADAYKVIYLNCTSMNSCKSVYSRIVSELKLKTLSHSEKASLTAIEKYLESRTRKMILIVLDELDQLCSSNQSVLYTIFEWPARVDSRLVLIGIANALDLTDRVLPRLQARLALQPTVLHFPSYTRQQIIDIIADRLKQAGVEEVFSGATLQLLAGKVAAVNGDVRRALDIARRVVEVAERRVVLQPLTDNGSTRQTVALQEVLSVVNDVYNTAQSLDSSQAESFPLQQKLLICSLLLIRQTSKAKDITIGKLHDVYKKVCGRRNLSALDMSEFVSLTSLVEARGILRVTGKTHNRLSKVVLQWDETEVKSALQDKQLLAAVLMDKCVAT
ncbi:cell division control protein 6 homolog [Homalodisca vitripennis]|uniref:cell division control protein 6 homolog n=1 Tax=Homalodisca vitripennis TaxID=197043 RepID=UPI001EEB2065|nr:cell division control protein 6 homolog [Homalodisca vitripennis]XP_046676139.1 cell division control protein 6 homolog [Homalodisca vitripennis]